MVSTELDIWSPETPQYTHFSWLSHTSHSSDGQVNMFFTKQSCKKIVYPPVIKHDWKSTIDGQSTIKLLIFQQATFDYGRMIPKHTVDGCEIMKSCTSWSLLFIQIIQKHHYCGWKKYEGILHQLVHGKHPTVIHYVQC